MRLARIFMILIGLGPLAGIAEANDGRLSLHYLLTVDTTSPGTIFVSIEAQNIPAHFQLAMATHHEYDDRFWRFVSNVRVEVPAGRGEVVRQDSALWGFSVPGHEAVVSYRVVLPAGSRFAHRPFLSPRGGLIGDIHSFMYVVGNENNPVLVTFRLPKGWKMATGLTPTTDSNTFSAASAAELLDCPVLAGRLHEWTFEENGIPHTVAYLPSTSALAFDTAMLIDHIARIVHQTVKLFGSVPYKKYEFLLEDGVYGALEHRSSVTIGVPQTMLHDHMDELNEEIAHEYSHTWNLMWIRPAEYTDLNYGPQQEAAELWFSEGLAMFYADLLVRRAGLRPEDSTRVTHLERLVTEYYRDTGDRVFTPAQVSLASNALPGPLGDYSASTHLQGELLGTLLDLIVRRETSGAKSVDDVMRVMEQRFGGKGFHAKDVEEATETVCGSALVHPFFEQYVYAGKPMDFDPYLKWIGLHLIVSYQPARDQAGAPAPDSRVYVFRLPGDSLFRLGMENPASCWVRAGLHTGDIILSLNGKDIRARDDFNGAVHALHIGDVASVQIMRRGKPANIQVNVTGYTVAQAHIVQISPQQDAMKAAYNAWASSVAL